ncbi:9788_t:CDS:2, partial [Dentiscutata erythropus]
IDGLMNSNDKINSEVHISNLIKSDDENDLMLEDIKNKIKKHKQFIQHIHEEYEAGNIQHVKALLNRSKRIYTMMDDIQKAQ